MKIKSKLILMIIIILTYTLIQQNAVYCNDIDNEYRELLEQNSIFRKLIEQKKIEYVEKVIEEMNGSVNSSNAWSWSTSDIFDENLEFFESLSEEKKEQFVNKVIEYVENDNFDNSDEAKSLDDYIKRYNDVKEALSLYYTKECEVDEAKFKEALRDKTKAELLQYKNAFDSNSEEGTYRYLKEVIQEKEDNEKYAQVLEGNNLDMWAPSSPGSTVKISSKASIIATVIRAVGTVVAVVALAIIGIRIMFGSIEQKAQYKELLVPYLIGAVMVFGISWITSLIFEYATQIG